MELVHDNKMIGHFGIKKTQDRVKSCFYWPCMNPVIRRYCKTFIICQKTVKKGSGGAPVPLGKAP